MAGNKCTSSQMDDGNDSPSLKTLDEILAPSNTDDLQDLFEIPDPPLEEDLTMLNAFDFQAPLIDDNDNNDTISDPGNALVLRDPTQATTVEEAIATDANEQAITENVAELAKPPRKRRRKGDPEPDHSALVREKTSKSKRCGQACDRCHIRRFKCDEVKGGCLMCLRSGNECRMTNRVTGETMVRGGGEGVVINFDDIQRENEEVKGENEKLHDEIEQLQSVVGKLQSQLQYYHNRFSIGAIPGPGYAPVSDPSRILPNPNPQAQAMLPASRNFIYGDQTNDNNGTAQPVASNYNNNAFSGNMSIVSSAPMPIPSSMPNALSHSEWAQPRLPQGLPTASRNNMVTYPPLSQVQAPMRDDAAQNVPSQGANGQGMNHGMQMQKFQGLGVQGQGSQNLPIVLDAQPDQVNHQGNVNTKYQGSHGQDTNAYAQGTSHSLKTLNQDFQVPPQLLTGGTEIQTFQHGSKNVQHQDFPNAKVPYKTAHDYPFNFPQPAPQSYLQPVYQFQRAGHHNADNQSPSFLNDSLGGIKSEDDTEVKFDLEPGFCWTPPLPATFPSLDLDTATKQTSTANLGDASTDFFTLNDSSNSYQALHVFNQEILGLLLVGMEEGLAQQKQSQPPVHQRVRKLDSENVELKTESPGNYNGGSHGFESSQGFGDIGPFV